MKNNIKLFIIGFISIFFLLGIFLILEFKESNNKIDYRYVASDDYSVDLYDENLNKVGSIYRGTKVEVIDSNKEYDSIIYNKNKYYILKDNLVMDTKEIVKENTMYVRTPAVLYEKLDSTGILESIKKGEELQILDFDYLDNGEVHKYKVKHNDLIGYIYGKYLVKTYSESLKRYQDEFYQVHLTRENTQGGGSSINLDFYPREKANFSDNQMPEEVKALYVNAGSIKDIESYINIAKAFNMNSLVIDIKDSGVSAYNSSVMLKYSKSNYEHALNSYSDYKEAIKKVRDAGLYLIGRITVFKDYFYALDNKENSITDTKTNELFNHNNSYWPTAFSRNVWEFNVSLAKEAVRELGFNEIQFDYVRFPDRTKSLEDSKSIDLKNTYNEEKVEAIQQFLMYATDEIHEEGAYVSADVFGESAHSYITSYGQYFPAISNVVDVISPMPYPDHFNIHEYNIPEVVWSVPYKLLNKWAKDYVIIRQEEIPTPAIVRSWIQCYDSIYSPKVTYDSSKIIEQIQALYDNNLTGGFMTWNASSDIEKYKNLKESFIKEYKK